MISKLIKHTSIYALGPQIPKIASLFVLPIITKDLTSFDYGVSGIVSAYLGGFVAFKVLGLDDVMVNYFYKRKNKFPLVWSHLYSFLSRYILLFGVLMTGLMYVVLRGDVGENMPTMLLLIIAPIVFFDLTIMFGSRYYQLVQNPKPVMIITAFTGTLAVLLNLYTISVLKMGYLGWYVSTCTSSLVSFLCYSYVVFFKIKLTPFIRPRMKFIRRYLKISFPLIPNKYGHYLLNTSDRVVMDLLKIPTKKLGLYTLGYNIGVYSAIVTDAIGIAIGPMLLERISKGGKKDLEQARALTFLVQILFFAGTVSASIWAKEIFQLLISNENMLISYEVAIFVFMAQNYAPLRYFFTNAVVYKEDTKILWKITYTTGMINVAANVVLIPIYGYIAAAITTLFSMLFLTGFGYYFKRFRSYGYLNMYPLHWLGISALLTGMVYFVKDISLEYKVFINTTVLLLAFTAIMYLLKKNKDLSWK